MAVDKLVDSTQLNSDLTSVANAIRTKGGTSAQLAFPAGFVSAIGDISGDGGGNANVSQDANGYIVLDDAAPSGGGGETEGNIADFIKWTPAFDDTWTVIEFDLISYPSSGIMTLPNPLGVIPTYIVVLKKNPTLSDVGGVIGGFNFISGASTDTPTNRNISFSPGVTDITEFGMFGGISCNAWSFINVGSNVTASQIQFRCATNKNLNTGYVLGHYIMGVKVV